MVRALIMIVIFLSNYSYCYALTEQQAFKLGYIGEKYDGYVTVVFNNIEALPLVQKINQKRAIKYTLLKSKYHYKLSDIAKKEGIKNIRNMPKGRYFLSAKKWQKKV